MKRRRLGNFAALLALALVAVQALGLAHRVAHGGLQGARPGLMAHVGHAEDGTDAARGHATAPGHEVGALFDTHERGGVECRLLDQAAQADALSVAAWPALPPRAPAAAPAPIDACRAASAAHDYLARGPPAGRLERPAAA